MPEVSSGISTPPPGISTMASAGPNPRASSTSRSPANPPHHHHVNNAAPDGKRDSLSVRAKFGKSFGTPRGPNVPGNGAKPSPNHDAKRNPKGGRGFNPRKTQPRNYQQRSTSSTSSDDRQVTEADEFEIGSVFNTGSKKTNLNHLLNFQYEARGTSQYQVGRRYGGGGNHSKRSQNQLKPKTKYKKEHYLQANCQFVVKSGSNLSAFLSDPDTLVDWNLIEQVGLKTNGMPACPICLYPPRSAKIAKCGHVYCWSCILHYFALSDDSYRKCPICYDSMCQEDIKSVVSLVHSELNTGDEIEMVLMRRERDSLFAVPVGHYVSDIEGKHPSVSQKDNSYSKILTASPAEVANLVIARERKELLQQYSEEKEEPEVCFIEKAMKALEDRERELLINWTSATDITPALTTVSENQPNDAAAYEVVEDQPDKEELDFEISEIENATSERPRHASSSSDGASSIEVEFDSFISAEDLDLSGIQPADEQNENSSSPKGLRKDRFYFYQASDGQAIFLHALNVQMLVEEYGSLAKCPKVIKGKILEKDHTSMTEELRNKLRYLRHLPITCSFEVCEVQLPGKIISKETFAKFKDQLDVRRRRRAKRAREEKRREKRIQVEADKLLGKYPEAKLRIESNFHFPEVGQGSVNLPSTSPVWRRSSESLLSSSPLSNGASALESSVFTDEHDTVPSFATMLREGAAKPARVLKKSDTFPALLDRARNNSDSEPEPEGYVPPPPKASMGDALALALEKATLMKNDAQPGKGKKKGKKRGTKILLTAPARPEI